MEASGRSRRGWAQFGGPPRRSHPAPLGRRQPKEQAMAKTVRHYAKYAISTLTSAMFMPIHS
ncbi:hypothetical protein [Streptacidiphilus albus]|uniref:hypothetical protein n=1 Tax=Streptacidiphilus albus TaxID=105425 RepID=UPI000A817E3A|nr:hypothetical protein [Streptacidiphilus albus]